MTDGDRGSDGGVETVAGFASADAPGWSLRVTEEDVDVSEVVVELPRGAGVLLGVRAVGGATSATTSTRLDPDAAEALGEELVDAADAARE